MNTTVGELMTTRVMTIDMDATLSDARLIFRDKRFHHLIVVEDGQPVGVISDRDLLKNLSPFIGARFSERPQDAATLQRRVHQMMTRKLVTISSDRPLAEAAQLMDTKRVSCLPVMGSRGELVGILTLRDILRWIVKVSKR